MMRPEKNLFIILLITSLLFQGSWTFAENHDEAASDNIKIPPQLTVPQNFFQTDSCDEAREWYDEGLLLSDNSNQEIYCYQRAIDLCPGFVAAHNRLGEIYKNQGKYILSINEFEQARIQAFSNNRFASRTGSQKLYLESVISLGEIYRILGKYKLAAEEFSKALEMDPDSPAAQNQLRYVYKRMHLYDDVLSPFDRLLINGIFTRIPGMTLPRNTFSFDLQYRQWKQTAPLLSTETLSPSFNALNPLPDPNEESIQGFLIFDERKTTVKVAASSLRYGLTNYLTIGLVPTFFARSLSIQFSDFRNNASNNLDLQTIYGIGDTELFVKYHIWGRRHKHLSIYTMVNLPTGGTMEVVGEQTFIRRVNFPSNEDSFVSTGGTMEVVGEQLSSTQVTSPIDEETTYVTENWEFKRYVPLGSESYDITPGLAFTLGLDPIILHTNMQYRFTDGKQLGDEFRLNCGIVYPLNRSVHTTLEMNYRWRGDVKMTQPIIFFIDRPNVIDNPRIIAGPVEENIEYTEPGGHSLFLSPGIQFTVADGVRLEFGMQIPVIKQDEGWMENIVYHVGMTFMTF